MEQRARSASDDGVAESKDLFRGKVALMPLEGGGPSVHLIDSDGKAYPARDRSVEDDFRLAVQNFVREETSESQENSSAGNEEHENGSDINHHACDGHDGSGDYHGKESNGPAASADSKERLDGSSKLAPSPSEHPLQKAINSFDMALGELNQLIHLIDLARAGEFMILERVTPKDERTRGATDHLTGSSEAFYRGALRETVSLHNNRLKGAAEQLRRRAKRLRETAKEQQEFQRGVVHLRKNWRVVAPNHGKVHVPLQVGEALSIDCSYGSAGGRPVPLMAAAGTRHRHPWLFQLVRGHEGWLEGGSTHGHHLKTLQVELVSALSGLSQSYLRATFPAQRCASQLPGSNTTANCRATKECIAPHTLIADARRRTEYDVLEREIARLQHSVFWEEVFENIKAEALVDGRNGWLAHQDRSDMGLSTHHPEAVTYAEIAVSGAGTKRRLTNGNSTSVEQDIGGQVVHVLDDEVMLKMNNQFLVGYRLVPGDDSSEGQTESRTAVAACSSDRPRARQNLPSESGNSDLATLCRLGLLYSGSMLRQHQRSAAVIKDPIESRATHNQQGLQVAEKAGAEMNAGRPSALGNIWRSAARVLRHLLLCKEVVRDLAHISFCLRRIGLPLTVRWTHLETTCASSWLSLTIGTCFHLRVSIHDESNIIVSALPGLGNHAYHRRVELSSAIDLQHFLLGEVCRQIVLTFGDIVSAHTDELHPERGRFRIQLVPAAIHLLPEESSTIIGRSLLENDIDRGYWEVRVCTDQKVGVQIFCSSWSKASYGPNGRSEYRQLRADSTRELDNSATTHPFGYMADEEVSVKEWHKLDGEDIFSKFTSLLAILYPSVR